LRELNIRLPQAQTPFGASVEAVQIGDLLFLGGLLPIENQKPKFVGRIGKEIGYACPDGALVSAVGSKAHKLSLHRIDLGEICRGEVIVAALVGHHMKTTVHEGRGRPCAAEMDECGKIPLLPRACRGVWRAGKIRRDKHGANRSTILIARSVAPSSSAPASDVIAPPSNAATTWRPSTASNPKISAIHSVCIGALPESSGSRSRKTTFDDSEPRCA